MWDGRETFSGQSIHFDLKSQANNATLGHSQAAQPLTDAQMESIVAFETALFTAQVYDRSAKELTASGAEGGPVNLSNQDFYIGINDLFGDSKPAPFDPIVFNIYDAWSDLFGEGQTKRARPWRVDRHSSTQSRSISSESRASMTSRRLAIHC